MPDFSLERAVHAEGFSLVAGVDEVGRGPLAGPVVAAAVIFPSDLTGREPWLEALDDSKRLSPAQRERAVELVEGHALAVGISQVGPDAVDSLGIGQASITAMLQAVENLPINPEYLLLDYIPLKECSIPFQTVVRGDNLSYSIAAASNVAKVTRDRMMREANEVYPGYSFDSNKGYGTAHHLAQLKERGPCQIHRRSFRPVRESLGVRQVG